MKLIDRWQSARKILCVRLDAMGDVVMTSAALRAVHEARPGRQITLLTSPAGAAAAALIPWVDEVIVYDAPWMKATAQRPSAEPDFRMIQRLASEAFDGAVIFTVYSQNPLPPALLCYLAGIPLRLAHCRENPYQLLTDWVAEPEPERLIRHEVRRQLDLVRAIGCRPLDDRLSIRVPGEAMNRIDQWLDARSLNAGTPWAVIHPGSTALSRRYAPESYAEVARQLVSDHGIRVVFTGDASESQEIEAIRGAMGSADSTSLAGALDLAELAALLDRAPVLISNNSGPVHLAAAVGTPVVDLYALTNPQHTPWRVPSRVLNHDVPCRYCYKSVCPEGHHDCLRLVTPDEVVTAALELLAVGTTNGRSSATVERLASVARIQVPGLVH